MQLQASGVEPDPDASTGGRRPLVFLGSIALAAVLACCLVAVPGFAAPRLRAGSAASEEEEEMELPHPLTEEEMLAGQLWQRTPALRSLSDCGSTCSSICPALKAKLAAYRVRPASEAPRSHRLDLGFYAKYINVMGIPILSSSRLCNCVLQKAAWIVHGLLSHLHRLPETLGRMREKKSRVAIMTTNEKTTDIPEHSDLTPKKYWDGRARGLGATPHRPASSGAEESVMCLPFSQNGYFGENILLHEFTHGITRTGFKFMGWDGKDWDVYNGELYESSKRKGLWKNTYAGTNKIEYFAEAVQSFFGTNMKIAGCKSDPQTSDGVHNCINTREELRSYDPELFKRLQTIFKSDRWLPGQGAACGCAEGDLTVKGFVALDSEGNERGGTGEPGDEWPGREEEEEAEIPVPGEPCLAKTTRRVCQESAGCKWRESERSCRHDCSALISPAACWLTGECAWEDLDSRLGCRDCVSHDDAHDLCESWARAGECSRNPGWMTPNCKLSCSKDEHANCNSWANSGECHRNPFYMLKHCPRACSCKRLKG